MRNGGLKLFSIVIALLLTWFVHSESNSTIRTFVAPVELRHLPNDAVVMTPLNPLAQVTVRGPSFILSRIPNSPPLFSVTFPDKVEDRYRVQLDPSTLELPPHVEVLNIDPPTLEFSLDTLVQRSLAVTIPKIGSVGDSLSLVSMRAEPDHILVTGPSREVKGLTSMQTTPVDLKGIKESTRIELAIRNIPQLTRLSTDTVAVVVDIAPVVQEKKLEQLAIEVRAASGDQFKVQPKVVTVSISGPKSIVESLKPVDVLAFVRVGKEISSSGQVRVGVETPPSIKVLSTDPEMVLVERVGPTANNQSRNGVKKTTKEGEKRT